MTDNEVWAILIAQLQAALTNAGYTTVTILQDYSPIDQGAEVETNPTYYLNSIGARAYGWQGREYVYNETTEDFDKTEIQRWERTYQLNVHAGEDYNDTGALTPYDYLTIGKMILQSEEFYVAMLTNGIGIERISNITQTYFLNDRKQYEADPSLDFVLTYAQELNTIIQGADVRGEVLEASQIPES